MRSAALNRYNTTKVAAVGYNGASATWQSATYTSSPQAPYSLVMQSVGVNPGCTCCCEACTFNVQVAAMHGLLPQSHEVDTCKSSPCVFLAGHAWVSFVRFATFPPFLTWSGLSALRRTATWWPTLAWP